METDHQTSGSRDDERAGGERRTNPDGGAVTTTVSSATDEGSGKDDDAYVIRPYEPGDRDDFLDLYDQVLGERDDEWFRWKYEDNPYADHVPMIVATVDGRVVGTKPCFALELRAGSQRVRGYQPADVMVHPDHRRRGLYSRTTERLKSHYRDRDPSLFFNFPNPATLSGSLKHGWQVVENVPTFYRVQRPDALVEDSGRSRLVRAIRPAASAYLRIRDSTIPAENITVGWYDDVPVEPFVELYERAIPSTIHANRDETFYRWRFRNPQWEYEAYVARRGGKAIAGTVVGWRDRGGTDQVCLIDVAPLESAPGREAGLIAILKRLLEDRRDAGLVAASGRAVPPALLRRFGFHADDSLPISALTVPTTQVTYPIADDDGHEWTVAGRAITDPTNWTVTFAEQDTF